MLRREGLEPHILRVHLKATFHPGATVTFHHYVNTVILSPEGKLGLYIGYVLFSTKYDHLFLTLPHFENVFRTQRVVFCFLF